jgi:prepilin-type processing-associated H-X9-DG protein
MFCPKCGVENQEDAKLCHSCSWVLASVGPTAPAPDAKTSALAIASLVLGILSFCTFFLTAPLGIILGIVGLFKIEKSQGRLKGRGIAIAGIAMPAIALPVVALLMGIMMPALARVKTIAYHMVCVTNMSALSEEMISYSGDNNDMYPAMDHWCDLLIEHDPALTKKAFRCKGDKEGPSSYAMNKNIEKLGINSPPDMVLLFESKPGWNQSGGPELLTTENHQGEGCNIMFNDGHVYFIQAKDINNLRWTAEPAKINH